MQPRPRQSQALRRLTLNGLLQSHPGRPGLPAVQGAPVLAPCGNTGTCPTLVLVNPTDTFPHALFTLTHPQT